MVRSHERVADGYELLFNDKLLTVFSNGGRSAESGYQGKVSPKYCVASLTEEISMFDRAKNIKDL